MNAGLLALLMNSAVEIAVAIVMLVALPWVVKRLNLSIDDKTRLYVENALRAGLLFAIEKVAKRSSINVASAAIKTLSDANTRDSVVNEAVSYVNNHVPDGIKRLGLTDEKQLRQVLTSRVAQVAQDFIPKDI